MEDLQYLCYCYIQFVGIGLVAETIRSQFHVKILDLFYDEEQVNYILHNLDTEISLPVLDYLKDVTEGYMEGYTEKQVKKYGKLLHKRLLALERRVV